MGIAVKADNGTGRTGASLSDLETQTSGWPLNPFGPRHAIYEREWAAFLREHGLQHSMSRRGKCHDNAVAESFFQLLKREKIRRQTYRTREDARRDVFEYIEMFYNSKRKHTNNGMLSTVDFENRQRKMKPEGV